MKKVTRSFWGAALGAFMSLWPAATFALAWLVIPGALFGWFLGYHGDRIWRGLNRGVGKVRKDIRTYPRQLAEIGSGLVLAIPAAGRGLVHSVVVVCRRLFNGLIWLVKNLFGFTLAYRGWQWLRAHPINRATAISVLMNIFGFGLVLYGILMSITYIPMGYTRDGIEVLPFGLAMLAAFGAGFHSLFALSFNESHEQFYKRWDRYNRFKLLYPAVELLRYLYVPVWAYAMMWISMIFLVMCLVAVGGGIIYLCVATVVFGIIRHTIRFAWRAVRYNRDYGVVSLAVSIVTGLVVYHNHEIRLVADPVFRLSASILSALVAGSVAALITYLIPKWIKFSYTSRQILMYKGDVSTWLLSRPLIMVLIEKKLKPMQKALDQKWGVVADKMWPNYAF